MLLDVTMMVTDTYIEYVMVELSMASSLLFLLHKP